MVKLPSRAGDPMISDILRFVEIDDETKSRGQEIWQLIEPHADAIVTRFYDKVRTFDVSSHMTDTAVG